MSIHNLATMSNDRLKKLAQECISLDDVYEEYDVPCSSTESTKVNQHLALGKGPKKM